MVETKLEVERVATGVQGFDELVEGGFPKDSLILLADSTGTGKSTFAMNFLVHGALNGEPGLYVSLEEAAAENEVQMRLFGWPVEKLKKEKTLRITEPDLYDFDKLVTHIDDNVAAIGAKRLVLDSTSIISMYFKDEFKVRRALLDLEKVLKNLSCTTIAITDIKEGNKGISLYGVEEFVVDGVVVLYFIKKENVFSRAIAVRKMRSTNHSLKIHPMQITRPGGVIVYPGEEIFTEL